MRFVATDLEMRKLLELRLVNRTSPQQSMCSKLTQAKETLNVEVMHSIETAVRFCTGLKWDLSTYPSSHESRCSRLPLPSSYIDFIASFVSVRPFSQHSWNANISSFLNYVTDELLRQEGHDSDDELRKTVMRELCHHLFQMKHWKQQPYWFMKLVFPGSEISNQTETLDINVVLASIILGRRTTFQDLDVSALVRRKSSIFGTLLDACVKGGQTDLVGHLLDNGIVDVNDENHSAIEIAAECPNADMLRTIFTPKYGLHPPQARMKKCIIQAINNDCTEAALYLLRNCDSSIMRETYPGDALRDACYHGHLAIVKCLVEELQVSNVPERTNDYHHWMVQHVAFYGHQHILRYLFEKGAEREPLTMRAAAMTGDIAMARFLHEQGVRLEAQTWASVLRVATDHETPRHFAWTCAVIEESLVTAETLVQKNVSLCNLIEAACVHGNVGLISLFVTAGLDINNIEMLEDTPPVFMALAAGRSEVARALVEMGAKPIDPLESKWAGSFESHELPKLFKARKTYHRGIMDWYDRYLS